MAASSDHTIPGVFWVEGQPNKSAPGRLDLHSRRPRVILASPLTSRFIERDKTVRPDGLTETALAICEDEPTVHGRLYRGGIGKVTLFASRTVEYRGTMWDDEFGEQVLEGEWALLGSHVDDDFRAERCTFRIRYLEEWANRGHVQLEYAPDGSSGRLSYQKPDDLVSTLEELGVSLRVRTRLKPPSWKINGSGFSYHTYFMLENLPRITLSELFSAYVGPVSRLATLCIGKDAPPVSISIASAPDDRWSVVRHPVIDGEGDHQQVLAPLMSMDDLGLDGIARWIIRHPSLAPVPALVSNLSVSIAERTVENQLLELAATCEGLHRRLYPELRRMTRRQADKQRRLARDAVDEKYRTWVNQALGHLDQVSYQERLEYLLERVSPVAPEVIGKRSEWIGQVKNARNGFAHQLLGAGLDVTTIESGNALALSLKWVLTILLLREAGVNDELLRRRVQGCEEYQSFLRYAKKVNPVVWPSGDA
jgi:ApeA N-terminal domain 1